MPTIEIDLGDLETLTGSKLPTNFQDLNRIFWYAKAEMRELNGSEARIELKDSNRVDLLGVEGLARVLCGLLNSEIGLKEYKIAGSSGLEVKVDPRLEEIRPYIGCAVIKGVRLSNMAIRQLVRFQEKIDQTYGRNRRKTSIGLYNFDLISPPLLYQACNPNQFRFPPLGFKEQMTLEEILNNHPKGIEYGHLVLPHNLYPIFIDSNGHVLSFPPIINSNTLGRITPNVNNILVEVTGTEFESVINVLRIITTALADRQGSIYSANVHYQYENFGEVKTPNLESENIFLDVKYIQKIIGSKMSLSQIETSLKKARYGISEISKDRVSVGVPCYRIDIHHQIDVIEDIAISYDYNKFLPNWPSLPTIGGLSYLTEFRNIMRDVMVGLGFQEILTYIMTNIQDSYFLMNIKQERTVGISNPKVATMTTLRRWLLPSLMKFLSYNTHVEYPQRIFEIGYCVRHDEEQENKTKDFVKIACVIIHSSASFSEVKSVLNALFLNLGIRYNLKEAKHGSFIDGRVGRIFVNNKEVGLIGEFHPIILENFSLENPASAIEIDLDELMTQIF